MLVTTHILSALLLGKYLGHTTAILLGAFLIDFDHLYHAFKHSKRKGGFFKAGLELIKPHPEIDDSRTFMHSILGWFLVSIIIYAFAPTFAIYFSIGYALHLVLDALDTSKLHLFYPSTYDVVGPVEFNSVLEYTIAIVMFIIYFWF